MIEFVQTHGFAVIIGYFIFNAIVSGMPEPRADSFVYLWLYRSLHTLAGNFKELVDFNSVKGSVSVHKIETTVKKETETVGQ